MVFCAYFRMTKEHLSLSLALKIPLIVVITKIDLCPENVLKNTLKDIQQLLKTRGVRKMPIIIKNDEDYYAALESITNSRVVPIFLISNVTGENMQQIRNVYTS